MATEPSTSSMVLTARRSLELREFPVPDVSGGGALLDVEMTSVCGSDIALYTGKSRHMDSLPLVLGHEVVGRVAEASDETLERWGVEIGDRVMPEPYIPCYDCNDCRTGNYHMCELYRCYGITLSADRPPHLWGGYGEYLYLDPNSLVHPVSEAVDGRAACLGSVVGNGVRWAVTKGDVTAGDSVVVIGPGAQGLATTIVADEAGADPLVLMGLSSDERRLDLGERVGATHTLFTDADGVEERVAEITDGGPDVVVVTAPASAAVTLGIDVVRPRGRVVLPGLVGEPTELDTDKLVKDEISLIGARGQALDVERAMGIVERRADDVAAINTHVFPLADAERAIRKQLPGEADFAPEIVHAALAPDGGHSR